MAADGGQWGSWWTVPQLAHGRLTSLLY
jgi:hypothetical protein